jgi:hypothetical protein
LPRDELREANADVDGAADHRLEIRIRPEMIDPFGEGG